MRRYGKPRKRSVGSAIREDYFVKMLIELLEIHETMSLFAFEKAAKDKDVDNREDKLMKHLRIFNMA